MDELDNFLNQIAPLLEGWRVNRLDECSRYLMHDSGARVAVRIGTYSTEKGRILLSGIAPRSIDGGCFSFHNWGVDLEIDRKTRRTFSKNRAVKEIAADLKRTVLPATIEAHKIATKRKSKELAFSEEVGMLGASLDNLLNGTSRILSQRDRRRVSLEYRKGSFSDLGAVFEFSQFSGFSSEVNIRNLSKEQLFKLAAFIKHNL